EEARAARMVGGGIPERNIVQDAELLVLYTPVFGAGVEALHGVENGFLNSLRESLVFGVVHVPVGYRANEGLCAPGLLIESVEVNAEQAVRVVVLGDGSPIRQTQVDVRVSRHDDFDLGLAVIQREYRV